MVSMFASAIDFAVNLTDATIFDTSVNQFGVIVAADGTYTATAFNDETATFTVSSARFNDKDHGWVNCVFTVPVNGPVKVGLGNCQYGAQTGTIVDGAGISTDLTVGNANCWHNDKVNNISYTLYKGTEPTTLTITYNGYCPFISVEAVDPSELSNDATVTFAAGEATGAAYVPEAVKKEVGSTITLPVNFTMYVEGKTMTGWTDGNNTFAPGAAYTVPEADVTLTAVFTTNEVSLADRTEAVTLKWDFQSRNGAPSVQWQNQSGLVWVTQATIDGKTIDVALPFSTNPGKFNNANWSDWCQVNEGTTFNVPSCKGAVVSIEAYNALTTTSIDGQTDYESDRIVSYTIASSAESVDVVMSNDGQYYRYIQVVLPVEQQGGLFAEKAIIDTDFQDWTYSNTTSEITTNFSNESITFTYVNTTVDPNATNEGKFPTSTDPAFKGYIMSNKSEATVTTTAFSNITRIRYRHGATGSNRGWGLRVKAAGDEDWTLVSDQVTNGNAWIEKELNMQNVQLQWYNLNTSQNAYMFELEVFANVEITAEQVTLTTAVTPEGAGSVEVYPLSDEYDKDTEVRLTAKPNFGYNFKQWTKDGEVLGTEQVLYYTIAESSTVTAEFEAVETYELSLSVDGTNDYMVSVSPAPTVVDGKMMYEAGTTVELTANQYEGLVTFTNWSDGETNSIKVIRMDEDVTVTAVYSQVDIIAGWDFYKKGSNGRKADFAAQDNDADALNLVNTETGQTSGWLDKSTEAANGYESFKGAAVNWREGTQNGDVGHYHWQTKINAEAFSDINVQFQMLYNFNAYQTYDVEYSLDGENWTNFGSITMTGTKTPASFEGQLPAECNNEAELYIRMIADKTSEVVGTASKNDGNTLAMFFITGTAKLVDDGIAPVLVSTVPADGATGVSASGKIVLTFDERVKLADGAVAYVNNINIKSITQNPTKGTVSGKTITFEYKGLEYSTIHNFILAANSVSDLTDNYINEAIELSFTTMDRPTVTKGLYDAVVSNVDELMAAISAAENRSDKNVRFRIFVKNGEYTIPLGDKVVAKAEGYEVPECITFINSGNISFIGESRDGVIITNGIDPNETFAGTYGTTSKYDGIGNSDVFQIGKSVTGLYWQDLTVESGMDDATGRDLAIHDKGTKNIYKNMALRGYQDTWTSNNDNGLYYFEGGYVRGRTDYMCGKGDIFWNGVELRQIAGGYAAVPSKPKQYGWIYKDCVINGEGSGVDGNYTLGRPWGQGTPIALFIDTKMNVVPSAIGWNEMSGGWPARFAEYNSMTSTGSIVDLSGRKTIFGDGHENNPVLTAEEALENSDLHRMFGDWDPTLATEQAPIPTNVVLDKSTSTLTWDDSKYALLWAIVKDGNVVDFTIEPSYTVTDLTADYSVRAANEMGGLSEASALATVSDGINTVIESYDVKSDANAPVYNMAGQRVSSTYKGIIVKNGSKYVNK